MGRNVEGSGRGWFRGTVWTFTGGDWGNPRKSSYRPRIWTLNILSSKQGSRPPALDVQEWAGHVICHMCIVLDRVAANLFTFWSRNVLQRLFCRCPEHRSCHGMSRWVQAVWRARWDDRRRTSCPQNVTTVSEVSHNTVGLFPYTALTLRLLMSYIYGAPILDVSRLHTTTQHSR